MASVKVEKNSYTVDGLYQWDLNQVLEIYGLSMAKAPEIHFTNEAAVRAVRRFATMDAAGVIRAEVPNALLQQPYKIKALVCIREGEVFKTYREIAIPVKARPQPADYTITDDDDIYSFLALENLVYESVAEVKASNAAATAAAAQAVATANAASATAQAAATTANGIAATAQAANTAATNANANAAAALEVANAAAHVTRATVTLPLSGWIGDVAPYLQSVAVEGILESDAPHVSPVYDITGTPEAATALRDAWALVSAAVTSEGAISFACLDDKPSTDINIQIEVVR